MTSRRLRIAALVAGLVLSAMVAVGESRTQVHHNTAAYLILGLLVGWSFMIAGQVAWLRRPTNLIGPLMCATALSWLSNGLTDWPTDAVLTVGELFASLWLGLLVHTILAYPSGRLRTLDARIVTVLVYLDTWVLSLLVLPFTEPRLDGADRHSAHNLLLVDHHHDLVRAADAVSLLFGICLIIAMLVILARRWQAAGVAAREVLAPVYLTGAVCMFVIGAVAIYSGLVGRTGDIPFYVFSLSLAAIPQGFLYGLLRTQIGRSGAVRGLIAEIGSGADPQRVRAAVGGAPWSTGCRRTTPTSTSRAIWSRDPTTVRDARSPPSSGVIAACCRWHTTHRCWMTRPCWGRPRPRPRWRCETRRWQASCAPSYVRWPRPSNG